MITYSAGTNVQGLSKVFYFDAKDKVGWVLLMDKGLGVCKSLYESYGIEPLLDDTVLIALQPSLNAKKALTVSSSTNEREFKEAVLKAKELADELEVERCCVVLTLLVDLQVPKFIAETYFKSNFWELSFSSEETQSSYFPASAAAYLEQSKESCAAWIASVLGDNRAEEFLISVGDLCYPTVFKLRSGTKQANTEVAKDLVQMVDKNFPYSSSIAFVNHSRLQAMGEEHYGSRLNIAKVFKRQV